MAPLRLCASSGCRASTPWASSTRVTAPLVLVLAAVVVGAAVEQVRLLGARGSLGVLLRTKRSRRADLRAAERAQWPPSAQRFSATTAAKQTSRAAARAGVGAEGWEMGWAEQGGGVRIPGAHEQDGVGRSMRAGCVRLCAYERGELSPSGSTPTSPCLSILTHTHTIVITRARPRPESPEWLPRPCVPAR